MGDHEKIINELLSNRIQLTDAERQSIARWPGQISMCVECGWEGGPSFRRIRDDEKSYEDLNDVIKGFLGISPLHIVSVPAMYNMFAIQVAERIAEFIMHMPRHPLALLCCDEALLFGMDDKFLKENDCELVDLSQVRLRPSGTIVWSGDVPKSVAAHLEHTNRTEQSETRRAYILDAMYPKSSSNAPMYYTAMEKLHSCSLDKLEDIAVFYSYGNYKRHPQKALPEYPGGMEDHHWLYENVHFEKWEPDSELDFHRDDYRILCNVFNIWKTSYEGEFEIEPDNSEFAEMSRFGHEHGIDSMVEALYAGVDLDDILA